MKVTKFRNENLRNEEWFQYYSEFKTLVEQYTSAALNIDALFTEFLTLYANADEALEIIRKSASTEQLAEADSARDMVFRGFAEAVKSGLSHFDPEKREAARKLKIVFDHYGNIARKSYDEETAVIYNFIQEMTGICAADITKLGLGDWVNQLDIDNQAFDAILNVRYDENAEKTTLRMPAVRKETDRNYRDMIDRIDASILLNGEAQYAPFVNALNIRVEHYSNIIEQRKGWNAKKN
ncbi:MAG: DUF6261 family protein [Prevotellaceae bacterium]|jgi:hypothetical protein|nr:DUF6261 family protein [Prevotellaceae bacterium]